MKYEPPFWWSGMKNPRLQILFHSESDLSNVNPKILNSDDVKILEIVHFESCHYLAIYLDLENAKPQKLEIEIGNGRIFYEIKERDPKSREIKGFDSSDVLYLIMPDRFSRFPDRPSPVDEQTALEVIPEDEDEEQIKQKQLEVEKEKEKQNENEVKSEIPTNPPLPTIPHIEKPNYPTFFDHSTNTERVKYEFDRHNPNFRHGGNLRGIIQHLEYIFDLGVTTIWLNPVLDNDMPRGSYHGYATTDFYNVDPRLGTNMELLELINRIHENGSKFVMDMIFNHCGSNHIWYKDPPSHDWFNLHQKGVITNHDIATSFSPYVSKADWDEFNSGSFVSTMPDLNQKNIHLATYLTQNSIWWIEFAQINGIRLDTYPYCDPDYMIKWVNEILEEYPNFNIVGEVWIESPVGAAYWQKGNPYSNNNLPTIMDFTFMQLSAKAFSEETTIMTGMSRIQNHLNYDFVYPNVFKVLRFLENHDTDRFLKTKPKNLFQFKSGFTVLLTIPGIPQIYYGTEVLMTGIKKKSDGYVRCDFPGGWKNDKVNCFLREQRTEMQNEAYDFLKKLLHWRKGNKIISKGSMKLFRTQNGIFVFERKYKNKSVIVIINGGKYPSMLSVKRYSEILTDFHIGKDIFTNKEVDFSKDFQVSLHEILVLEMH